MHPFLKIFKLIDEAESLLSAPPYYIVLLSECLAKLMLDLLLQVIGVLLNKVSLVETIILQTLYGQVVDVCMVVCLILT
jgi:hypothetical protein